MKPKVIALAVLFASTTFGQAEEPQAQADVFAPARATAEWKPRPELWDQVLSEKRQYPTVTIGRGSYAVRGPLVETFQRPSGWSDLSLGQKILSFPVINWFVPRKMPKPPGGGGKYFAWGESDLSWTAIAHGASPGTVQSRSIAYHEPQGLISIGW